MLRMITLGTAAGGGVPQWNCACLICQRARNGDPQVPTRSQASLACSGDDRHWFLINAPPDLRQQIAATPALHPACDADVRDSPITGVVLTSAEIDHVAGLLCLRERQPLVLYATAAVLAAIAANPIFSALALDYVRREALSPDVTTPLRRPDGSECGLAVSLIPVPGKVALYLERGNASDFTDNGTTVAAEITAFDRAPNRSRRVIYAPGCAAVTPALRQRLAGADLLFFDGTVWRDDDLMVAGVGTKTGRRMGHLPMSGADGSIAALADVPLGGRVFTHINNTNPILCADAPERAQAERDGWIVAADGAEFRL